MDDNESSLTPEERDALVNHVFDAIRAVAWVDDWGERQTDQAFSRLSTVQAESVRNAYFEYAEELRPEFQAEAAKCSNRQLCDMLKKWMDRGDELGVRQQPAARDDYQRMLDEKAKGVETNAKVPEHGRER